MSEVEFPQSWIICELAALGNIVTGKTPSTTDQDNFSGDIPFIKPGDLNNGGYIVSTADTLSIKGLMLIPRLPKHAITVTCIGNLGKIGITTRESATNQQINSVIPSEYVHYKYLYYFLSSMKWWLEQEASATTVAIINKGKFSKAPIKLPPLAEQQQIAAKLDELLAQVDSLKTRLDAIPKILKRFRQSVLAAAVSGKLTEDWREGKEAWKIIELQDVANIIDPHPSHRTPVEVQDGVPYIGIGDLNKNGTIDFDNARKVSRDVLKEHKDRYQLKAGDFVFGKIGTLGKATILPVNVEYTLSANVILIQPKTEIANARFLMFFLSSPSTMDEIARQSNSTSQAAFGIKKMRSFICGIPLIEEQIEIVRRVELFFAYADQIEQRVKDAQSRVNHLTQSILAKAFRGELTAEWREQNPDLISGENSAEALLARIQDEREASGKVTKRSRKVV